MTCLLLNTGFICIYRQSSNMLNQARLKALKVREDYVRDVLDEARRRLAEIPKNEAKYVEILRKLLVQGLLQVCIRGLYA